MSTTMSNEPAGRPFFDQLEPRVLLSTGTLYEYEWTPNVPIQDNGGWDGRAVWSTDLSGAPSNATITDVDIEYWIDHTWIGDLKVWLTTERSGQWYDKLLWDREGGSADDIHEKETGLDNWDNLDPNGTWYLMAADYASGHTGEIDAWKIWVHWATLDKPDLTPYKPSGWSNKIVVSTNTGDNSDDSPIFSDQNIYIDWAVTNDGDGPATSSYYTALYVHGSYRTRWNNPAPHNVGYYKYVQDYNLGTLSAGSHSIEIRADYTDVIDEKDDSSSDNNYSRTITVYNRPDLVVQSVTETLSSYEIGDTVQARATIKNQGGYTAGGSDLKYYLGTADGSDKTYKYIEQGSIGSLGVNGTGDDIINWPYWTIPSDVAPGQYRIWVLADSSGDVYEGSAGENNNWGSSSTFTVYGPRPDLTPYEPSGWSDKIVVSANTGDHSDDSPIFSDETIYIDWGVTNDGDGPATSSYYTALYVDGSYRTRWNNPAPHNVGVYKYVEDYDLGTLSAGSHSIEIRADYTDVIDEKDDSSSDNNYTRTITVYNRPDLIVQSVTETQPSYQIGDTIQARATIKNQGGYTAVGSDLKFYLGTADGSDKTYRYIEQGSVGSLDVDATEEDIINWPYWTIPGDVAPEQYRVWVLADSSGDVYEGSTGENNNWGSSGAFEIEGQHPEIDVQGNGYSIPDNDTTPSPTDGTDFGTVDRDAGSIIHLFTILNTGPGTLNLTGSPRVSLSGSTDFVIVSQPASSVASGGSTTFEVKFDPTSTGVETATVNIISNDEDENPYNFMIQGTGTASERYMLYEDWGGIWRDAEKDLSADDDDLCWAAAASNVLGWTGWGNVSGMNDGDEDVIFDYLENHWTDVGGRPQYGWDWWFDGTGEQGTGGSWSQVDVPGGGFYPAIPISSYMQVHGDPLAASYLSAMSDVSTELEAGRGTTVFIAGGNLQVNHELTVWGFDYDTGNPNYFVGIWLSDSDDNKDNANADNAPNYLLHYSLIRNDNWWLLWDGERYLNGEGTPEPDYNPQGIMRYRTSRIVAAQALSRRPTQIVEAPVAPSWISASESLTDRIRVTWASSERALSYDLYRGATDDYASASLLRADVSGTIFDDTTATSGTTYYYWVKARNNSGSRGVSASDSGRRSSLVAGRHVFYNNSSFDGNDAGANANDDNAIGTDKQALLPGGTATFANYTSYRRGINGVIVDVDGLADADNLNAGDFTFKVGNDDDPGSWGDAPDPVSITVRQGEGDGGSDRVTIVWADNAIAKEWLQVTVLATDNTGLPENDVFYFGNAVGDTGNSATNVYVNAFDTGGVRDHPRGFLNPAPIDDVYDFNRDQRVNAFDFGTARDNATGFLNALWLITMPAATGGMMMVGGASGGGDEARELTIATMPQSVAGEGVSTAVGRSFVPEDRFDLLGSAAQPLATAEAETTSVAINEQADAATDAAQLLASLPVIQPLTHGDADAENVFVTSIALESAGAAAAEDAATDGDTGLADPLADVLAASQLTLPLTS